MPTEGTKSTKRQRRTLQGHKWTSHLIHSEEKKSSFIPVERTHASCSQKEKNSIVVHVVFSRISYCQYRLSPFSILNTPYQRDFCKHNYYFHSFIPEVLLLQSEPYPQDSPLLDHNPTLPL